MLLILTFIVCSVSINLHSAEYPVNSEVYKSQESGGLLAFMTVSEIHRTGVPLELSVRVENTSNTSSYTLLIPRNSRDLYVAVIVDDEGNLISNEAETIFYSADSIQSIEHDSRVLSPGEDTDIVIDFSETISRSELSGRSTINFSSAIRIPYTASDINSGEVNFGYISFRYRAGLIEIIK